MGTGSIRNLETIGSSWRRDSTKTGAVIPGQATTILDVRRMRDLNFLPVVSNADAGINTWEVGNQALAAYQQYLAEAAIIWPDLIVSQPGFGDEGG